MMDYKKILGKIERYMSGEASIAEERWLYGFFSAQRNLPPQLEPYAEYFRDLATLDGGGNVVVGPPRKAVTLRRVMLAAAVAVLAVGLTWGYRLHEDAELARMYAGSYVVVDGRRCDNLREIKDSIRLVLAASDKIERKVGRDNLVEQAEREVLQSVSPGQREDIEQLLK